MPAGVGAFLFGRSNTFALPKMNLISRSIWAILTRQNIFVCKSNIPRIVGDEYYANPLGPIHLSETPTIAERMDRR